MSLQDLRDSINSEVGGGRGNGDDREQGMWTGDRTLTHDLKLFNKTLLSTYNSLRYLKSHQKKKNPYKTYLYYLSNYILKNFKRKFLYILFPDFS